MNRMTTENELSFNPKQIIVTKGLVKFMEYDRIKNQALQLAEQINTVEVNEDNIKESKKLLAAVNKKIKELEDERIRIKKLMLEPYEEFEGQVKEIVKIVKDADAEVRGQVREMEENERSLKEIELHEMFLKRRKQYPMFDGLINFLHFLENRHLNKTVSIDAVEKEMIDFLERTKKDFEVISSMDHAGRIMAAYLEDLHLANAIQQIARENAREKEIEASRVFFKQPTEKMIHYLVSVKVYNQKELKLLERILQENEFEFMTDKVTIH
jgi:hypothetical protein